MSKEEEEYQRVFKKAYGKDAQARCRKCIALCCRILPGSIYVNKIDMERFKNNHIKVKSKAIIDTEHTYVGTIANEGDTCPFYQNIKGKSCKIYNARPDACRKFSPLFCGMFRKEELT